MSEERYIIIQKSDLHPEQVMALRHWLKSIDVQAVSEEYALVPVIPTREMIDAWRVDQNQNRSLESSYLAMIKAAQEND